ncbi:MAG: NAD(P)H-quinone oxidoreductase subunit 3 [Phycisphaerae bacterium]|nr:NAD(P)H-quinone oxidoreductase subunit 3 [Phycisphaerae bacterium]
MFPVPDASPTILPSGTTLAQGPGYLIVAILIVLLIATAGTIFLLSHLIGPSRKGAIKDGTYESGVDPFGDTRRRFNVRFYIVAMLFLLFDVEIVFFYPWATLFPRVTAPGDTHAAYAAAMRDAGFGPAFLLIEMFVFVAILLVGYVYAWRKGAFRWT